MEISRAVFHTVAIEKIQMNVISVHCEHGTWYFPPSFSPGRVVYSFVSLRGISHLDGSRGDARGRWQRGRVLSHPQLYQASQF